MEKWVGKQVHIEEIKTVGYKFLIMFHAVFIYLLEVFPMPTSSVYLYTVLKFFHIATEDMSHMYSYCCISKSQTTICIIFSLSNLQSLVCI